jgi:hypothetical protein
MIYVYILPLLDGFNMKIGVSEGDLSRILKHHETYGVIYEQIRILNCKNKKLAFKVEKYLLDNLPKPLNKLIKNDGYSEIREIKHLNKCKELLIKIKKDPLFSYQESKCIEYKYYSINELKTIYKELHDIDLSSQIEKLTNIDYKKYSSIYEPKYGSINW